MEIGRRRYTSFLRSRGCTIHGNAVFLNNKWVGTLEETHFRLAVRSLETANAVTGKTFVENCIFVTLPSGSREIPYLKRRWR